MSRKDNPSLQVRGVPRPILDRLDAWALRSQTTRNALTLAVIRDYADGKISPKASPPAFEPARPKAAPYAGDTAPLSVSGIPSDVFSRFMERAKRDQWFSKNDLIVELLRTQTEAMEPQGARIQTENDKLYLL